jgi:NTE family protein
LRRRHFWGSDERRVGEALGTAGNSKIVLALAGGNALGAYAAGAYEAMHAHRAARIIYATSTGIDVDPAVGSAGRGHLRQQAGNRYLIEVVDFDRLNSAELPLIVTAVDMETGEPVLFDTRKQKLEGHHFLATTAFTPAFPPTDVDGRCLGDPGLISNLPIDALLDPLPEDDTLCFAVDLFESRGARPISLETALERAQDIAFSTQALRTIERHGREHRLRRTIAALAAQVHTELPTTVGRGGAEPLEAGRHNAIEVVLIAYRARQPELATKTMEFSRASVRDRWQAGRVDMERAINKLEAPDATIRRGGFTFYDARRAAAEV